MTNPRRIPTEHSDIVAYIHELVDTFENHTIKQLTPSSWLCMSSKTGEYWFGVMLAPGAIVVYGDIDEIILRPHSDDNWVLGVKPENYDYSLGKVPVHLKGALKDFDYMDADDYLSKLEEDPEEHGFSPAEVGAIKDEWDGHSVESFTGAQIGVGVDEPYDALHYNHGTLLSYAALCWFVECYCEWERKRTS